MALQDILNTIDHGTQERESELKAAHKETLAERKALWQERLDTRREELLDRARNVVDQKVQAAELQLRGAAAQKVLLAKKDLLDRVFADALTSLGELSDDEYVEVMADRIAELPDADGTLESSGGKESLLEKAVKKAGKKFPVKAGQSGSGGFAFHTDELSVDNTFEALVAAVKDDLKVEVGSVLFSAE